MKNSKLLLFILLSVSFMCFSPDANHQNTHYPLIIGTMIKGTPTITTDLNTLEYQWEAFMSNSIDLDQSTFVIMPDTTGGDYILYGSNTSGDKKAAVALELHGNNFYEDQIEAGGKTVICIGCVGSGCNPRDINTADPWCSDCDSPGTCNKSVTVSADNSVFQ